MTSSPDQPDHVPWDRTRLGLPVLTVNGVVLVVAAIFVIWLMLDAGSVPSAVAVVGTIGLVLLTLNALIRLIVLLGKPDAFK